MILGPKIEGRPCACEQDREGRKPQSTSHSVASSPGVLDARSRITRSARQRPWEKDVVLEVNVLVRSRLEGGQAMP